MEYKARMAEEECRRFVNSREILLDVVMELERGQDEKFARKLKKRALEARSEQELRMVMDGLLVLAGFHLKSNMTAEMS